MYAYIYNCIGSISAYFLIKLPSMYNLINVSCLLYNRTHLTNTMLKDKELSSDFEGNVVGSYDDQKTTNDNHSVVNNGTYEYNSYDTHIRSFHITVTDVAISNSTENGINSSILVADMTAKASFVESCICDVLDNAKMINLNQMESNNESLVFKEKAIKAVNITKDNVSHQICISQEVNVGASLPESSNKMKRSNSLTNTSAYSDVCCKVSIVFGVCFIIGFFLIPLILYYVNQTGENSILDPDHSYGQNKLSVKVCYNL